MHLGPSSSAPAAGQARDALAGFVARLVLSRSTAMPLYRQLETQLAGMIELGVVERGSTLPAERDLALSLGVSRATVQQCYGALRQRGLIVGRGRHGSLVSGTPRTRLQPGMDRLRGFTQEMAALGRRPSSRVIEHRVVSDRAIASLFGRPSTARFLRLVRVRLGDHEPLSVESAWYSLDAAPVLEHADPAGSIYAQLAEHGLGLAYCDQTIEATFPDPAESEVFGFDGPVPSLLIKRRSFLADDTMVEYVEGLFRGDSYRHSLRLTVG